jgi:broad specificity phosphatase PhoE
MYELTFVRHGESNGNAAKLSMGNSPGFLTQKGIVQATVLNQSLKEVFLANGFHRIYSSDLRRVVETCQIALRADGESSMRSGFSLYDSHMVASVHVDTLDPDEEPDPDFNTRSKHVRYTSLLREKHAGMYELRPKWELTSAYKDCRNPRKFRPPEGESWDDVQKRVVRFIDRVRRENRFGIKDSAIIANMTLKEQSKWWGCCGGGDGGDAAISTVPSTMPMKRILIFTSGGVIKEFINAYVLKTNTRRGFLDFSGRQVAYYPNQIHNCGMFVFRCNSSFTDVKMVVENRSVDDAGNSSWDKFMEENEPEEAVIRAELTTDGPQEEVYADLSNL